MSLCQKKNQSFRHIDSMGAFASPLGDCTFSLVFRSILLPIFMLLISSDSLIICVFIDIIIHISTFSSEIDNRSLVGVLQNGPKPQLSILKNMHYFIDLKIFVLYHIQASRTWSPPCGKPIRRLSRSTASSRRARRALSCSKTSFTASTASSSSESSPTESAPPSGDRRRLPSPPLQRRHAARRTRGRFAAPPAGGSRWDWYNSWCGWLTPGGAASCGPQWKRRCENGQDHSGAGGRGLGGWGVGFSTGPVHCALGHP